MSPPATDDPFSVLGVRREFRIDVDAVKAAHRRLAAAAHPDRAAFGAAREDAARRSAALNEALRTLLDPVLRAESLLTALESSTGLAGQGETASQGTMSPQFLAEIMELRESVDAAEAASDRGLLEVIASEARQRRGERIAALAAAFEALQEASPERRPGLAAAARLELNSLRYLQRLLDRVVGALQ